MTMIRICRIRFGGSSWLPLRRFSGRKRIDGIWSLVMRGFEDLMIRGFEDLMIRGFEDSRIWGPWSVVSFQLVRLRRMVSFQPSAVCGLIQTCRPSPLAERGLNLSLSPAKSISLLRSFLSLFLIFSRTLSSAKLAVSRLRSVVCRLRSAVRHRRLSRRYIYISKTLNVESRMLTKWSFRR
jgi:hypothetical protein